MEHIRIVSTYNKQSEVGKLKATAITQEAYLLNRENREGWYLAGQKGKTPCFV